MNHLDFTFKMWSDSDHFSAPQLYHHGLRDYIIFLIGFLIGFPGSGIPQPATRMHSIQSILKIITILFLKNVSQVMSLLYSLLFNGLPSNLE